MELLLALPALSFLPWCARAHMQMSNPYPINSPLNPTTPESLKDYSYTTPLLADGSNFPCKGYQAQLTSYNTTATYTAGSTYSMSIAGGANHGGGSCQLSLSYDNGQTFKVIKSMIGGCPVTTTYNFVIPIFSPSSQSALFAWTWFNEIGNREMYMNCARVEIQAVTPGRHRRVQHRRQASMSSLPDLFICNVNNGCTTIEQENVQFPDPGTDVVYGSDDSADPPLDGTGFIGSGYAPNSTDLNNAMPSATTTSGPYANTTSTTASVFSPNPTISATASVFSPNTTTPTAAMPSPSTLISVDIFTVSTTATVSRIPPSLSVSVTDNSSSAVMPIATASTTAGLWATSPSYQPILSNPTSPNSPLSPSPQSPTISSTTLGSISQSTSLPAFTIASPMSSSTIATITSSSTAAIGSASVTLLMGPCIPGAFACNSATTFSQCVAGLGGTSSYVYMGSVAAGMECSNGQIIRQNDGPCTPNGQLFCHGEFAFYLCDQGGLINMGPVAPGTACVNGVIGYQRPRM